MIKTMGDADIVRYFGGVRLPFAHDLVKTCQFLEKYGHFIKDHQIHIMDVPRDMKKKSLFDALTSKRFFLYTYLTVPIAKCLIKHRLYVFVEQIDNMETIDDLFAYIDPPESNDNIAIVMIYEAIAANSA